MGLLDGKKALVMGVGNKRSIAWGIATAFQREGAELAFNWPNDRLKDNVLELVATLPQHESIPVGPCDVSKQEEEEANRGSAKFNVEGEAGPEGREKVRQARANPG